MKWAASCLLVVSLTAWLEVTQSQTADCNSTDRGNQDPVIVTDLPVCSDIRDQPQCCSRDYILDKLNTSRSLFIKALRAELQPRFELFGNVVDRLRNFFDSGFLEGLFRSFADLSYLRDQSTLIGEFTSELRNHLTIDRDRDQREGKEFSASDLLERLLERVKEDVAQQSGTIFDRVKMCLRDLIQGKVDAARMKGFAAAIEQIRRVKTLQDRIGNFLDKFNQSLAGYQPLQVCVDRVVELNNCGSCLTVQRPLCRNVCGALARACYSPFYQVLNRQFVRFWQIVRDTVKLTKTAISRLNENRRVINIGQLELVADGIRMCAANFTNEFTSRLPFRKRQTDDDSVPDVPSFVSDEISDLVGGAFEYGVAGPRLCQSFVNTVSDNCWDGMKSRPEDIDKFTENEIDGQDGNPAIQIDMSALQQQAQALGSPVDVFIESSSFTDVAPDGLTSGSLRLGFSLSALVVGLMAAIIVY